jgi:ABC-type sulfate transport system permease component
MNCTVLRKIIKALVYLQIYLPTISTVIHMLKIISQGDDMTGSVDFTVVT